jgi:hypothetical protein
MKNLNTICFLTALMIMISVSCNNNPNKAPNDNCQSSYELIAGDKVNVISCHGKQGKWVPSKSNQLQDTTYYKNDTIIEK